MRVAVDARELEGRPTGVGRVLQGLLEAWPAGDQLDLICRTPPRLTTQQPGWQVRLAPGPRWMPGTVWEQLVLPAKSRHADALLCPAYGMPRLAPCPTAVCMHDCAPFAVPETFGWRQRKRRQAVARLAARRAAFLFMGSEFAAAEARRHLGLEPERSLVIPWGLTRGFRPPTEPAVAAVRRAYDLPGRIILFVGSALQRRDLGALLELSASLAASRPDLRLCLVGGSPERTETADERTDERWLRRLGYVPDEHLPALYGAASVVAYPSRYEGFGLPVLEALACGAPVVASRRTALAEVYAERAWLVEHDRPDQWRAALETLLDNPGERRSQIAGAQAWALDQAWDGSAAALRKRLAQAAGETP